MSDPTVTTDNTPRDVIDAWELTPDERAEFDYLDWDAIEAGNASASFFRYDGDLYDLGEFMADAGLLKGSDLPDYLRRWDAYQSQHAFLAIVVRYVEDDQIIVGRVES